ncbi:HD domain-containing phosphohydrolase [Paenibacillus gansuensis]|uniref:HD domain-containing phosphohydrolase n=1 Tax=Paenibacillus gansuensis TaxID=306542 RepID=A0ABW5PKE1_9BACL
MRGLHLGINGIFLEKTIDESSELSLLARGDGSEVILQKINAEKTFYVFPGEHADTMEFFFILEGTCTYDKKDERISLHTGDYFYVKDLEDPVYFKAQTDVSILWFSTQPFFHFISKSIENLTAIVKQIEEKDQYTYQHSVRVQDYSLKIAKELQLSKDKLENLYFASLFHDVGKINTPAEIMNKTGTLTEEEFEIVKRHAADGYDMVQSSYYDQIGQIILQHHERLDGSGYPNGLKGDQIILEAQIISVADTFDAMTSDRPYRKGMDRKQSLNEIKSLIGVHYNRDIVEAFEKALLADGLIDPS